MGIEFLKQVTLFNELSDKQLNLIAALVSEEKVSRETELIKEGAIGKYLYIIREGKVRVVKKFGEDIFPLTELVPIDFFGEMALIDDYPTSATVVTIEDSIVYKINADDFKTIVRVDTDLSAKIWEALARVLSDRIRKTSEIVRNYYGLSKALCENEEFRALFTSWNFSDKKE
jgi:CRP-like cAMP-binding protein